MSILFRTIAGAALLLASSYAAGAAEIKAGDLVITEPWSRATPAGAKVAGGFLTIENKGATADRLLSGSAPVAGKFEVHEMRMEEGVMKMRPLDNGLEIAPGKTVKLVPGGYHLMLMDLQRPLKEGEQVPVTLQFEKAGTVQLSLDVQGIGAKAPAGAAAGHGGHQMAPGHSMAK